MSVKCPKCQHENPDDTLFCGKCGTQLPSLADIEVTDTIEAPKEELTRGTTFAGRYEIIEELGKGGMGRVYRVEDKKTREELALKLIKPEISADKKTIERFTNELRLAHEISHRNVCRMYHLGEEKGTSYITMEYVPGEDLRNSIRRFGQLPIGKSISIANQICEGLAEAHRLGVVHRDLKSNNIMIDKEGNARIMDFGIARSVKTEGLTDSGVMIGTPEYMSPEQVEGKEVDQRSDIYALGVILYEMLTGRIPFEGDTPMSIAIKHKSEAPQDPKSLNFQIPDGLSQMILKCLEKDKQRRYQNTGEVCSELNRIEEEIATTQKTALPKKAKAKPTRRHIRPLVIPVILICFIVIVTGYFLLNRKQKPEEPKAVAPGESTWQKKIVVLPFDNLGSTEDAYFADGITSEITSRLAVVKNLGVISRQTAIQYERRGKTLKEIGDELGVNYALEGTVLWDKGREGISRIRVVPQLVRTIDDTQIWSEPYERDLNDIFSVQSDIAEKVVEKLDIALLEPEQKALKSRPTENLEAYQFYLHGLDYIESPRWTEEEIKLAVQMFERAVKIDPDFALAFAGLSYSHSDLYHFGYDRTEERAVKAKEAAERALDLQPKNPASHLALGRYYYECRRDYAQALSELTAAQREMPNSADIAQYIGFIVRRQGKYEESVRLLKKAFELNPKDTGILTNIGFSYQWMRRYQEADSYYSQALALVPDLTVAWGLRALNQILWQGASEKSRATLKEASTQKDSFIFFYWLVQECNEGHFKEALDRISSAPGDFYFGQGDFTPWALLRGFAYRWMEKEQLAQESFKSALALLEREVKKSPEDSRIHSSLGIAYGALGRKEEAVRKGKQAVRLYPVSKDTVFGPARVYDLARIFVLVEEYDEALIQLEYLLSIPSPYSAVYFHQDPFLDPLKDLPGFKRMIKKYSDLE